MKKIVKIMFSSLLVVFLMLTAVACGLRPIEDWRKVRNNLMNADYLVLTASSENAIEEYLEILNLSHIADAEDINCLMYATYTEENSNTLEIIALAFCKEEKVAEDIRIYIDENKEVLTHKLLSYIYIEGFTKHSVSLSSNNFFMYSHSGDKVVGLKSLIGDKQWDLLWK